MPSSSQDAELLSLVGPDRGVIVTDADSKGLFTEELQAYDTFDEEDERTFNRRIQLATVRLELKQFNTMLKARKRYAGDIFRLLVGWLIGLGAILLASGLGQWSGFSLDTKVLLALVGGTTLNVLGIFAIVANFLFPKSGPAALHAMMSRAGSALPSSVVAAATKLARTKMPAKQGRGSEAT